MKLPWIRGAGAVSIGLLLALGLPRTGSANVSSLPAARDATLIESPTGALANGAGPHFFAGRTGQSADSIRRGVLAFDVAAHVPPGVTVTAVRLVLHVSQSNAGPVAASLHRALDSWGEGSSSASGGSGAPAAPGDTTWLHRSFDQSFWGSPGGDYLAATSASALVGGEGWYAWDSTPALVADVQSWQDDPASNHGWILVGDESASTTVKRFDSRENADDSLRPLLEVEFGRPGGVCTDAGLTGNARGVCTAYCEELDCDGESPLGSRVTCTRLDRVFERLADGALLPCEDDDGDGVEDALDNCPTHTNAEQGDGDLDAVGDACDNCPAEANPLQEESFGDAARGDACDCPCFSAEVATALVLTLTDATRYEGLTCIDTRVSTKPLTAVRAERSDGAACGTASADCSALAVEFTEDQVCQLNPPAPAESLAVSISGAQREACRVNLLAAAASVGLLCD